MDAASVVKNIIVMGATGSIGDSTFRVLENLGPDFRVLGMSGGEQLDKLAFLADKWQPRYLCTGRADITAEQAGSAENVLRGEAGLKVLAALPEADIVVNGLVGAVGLRPTLAALEAGKVVAIANKEPFVIAGGLLLEAAGSGGGELIPLDSEPNAIWQCLKGEQKVDLERVILTASGGPFFARTLSDMEDITPEEALNHPTWKMGAKITVDSATLINKGFEVIEASWLFDRPKLLQDFFPSSIDKNEKVIKEDLLKVQISDILKAYMGIVDKKNYEVSLASKEEYLFLDKAINFIEEQVKESTAILSFANLVKAIHVSSGINAKRCAVFQEAAQVRKSLAVYFDTYISR